ncbi:MAG: hypothetical protein IAE97_04930 [Chthoniobacterales bacterium]|nr:hypothetical protein [Chthoniobacterales bacterium]
MTALLITVVFVAFLLCLAASLPAFPARELAEHLLGRPPGSFASAIEIRRPQSVLWLAEYRATSAGTKSDSWFTLVAKRLPDDFAAVSAQHAVTISCIPSAAHGCAANSRG